MSNFTDFGENWVCNFIKTAASSLPANFDIGLLSSVAEDSYTEVNWTGYSRQSVARSLAAWSGTQGNGSVSASTGNSHTTSNNEVIDFGTAAGDATITAIGMFAGSDLFAYSTITSPITVSNGDPVKLDVYSLVCSLGATGGLTDYLSNKLIDFIWRGQTYNYPATMYLALYTSLPSNNTRGTEVTGGGYVRVPVNSSAWSAPSGGTISNSENLSFPVPTANWGNVVGCGLLDSATSGNLLWWAAVNAPKSIVNGGASPRFDAGALTLQVL